MRGFRCDGAIPGAIRAGHHVAWVQVRPPAVRIFRIAVNPEAVDPGNYELASASLPVVWPDRGRRSGGGWHDPRHIRRIRTSTIYGESLRAGGHRRAFVPSASIRRGSA